MKTKIKTIHEEEYSQNDKKRIIGILSNYSIEDNVPFQEGLMYTYKDGIYIFFNTIVEMINYLLYGESKMKRAYMEEKEFDKYYDSNYINGAFNEYLTWIN